MANLTETPVWEEGIYQWETTDPVLGGPDGIDNVPTRQLGNRTAWLKSQVDSLVSSIGGFATTAAVQALINSLDFKQSVRAATTANITLSGVQTIDGVSLLVGDRVLVKDQTVASQNGIYVVSGSAWSRSADADADAEITPGLTVYVEAGTKQGKTRWQVITPSPISLGTTSIAFAIDAAGTQANGFRSIALSAATVALNSDDAGSVIAITGSGGGTLVLPAANSVMAGEQISLRCNNTSVSTNTLKGAGTDTIGGAIGANANTAVLRPNDSMVLVSDGVSKWDISVEATTAFIIQQFTAKQSLVQIDNVGGGGYQVLPGGLIIQWVGITTLGGGYRSLTFPIAFPNAFLGIAAINLQAGIQSCGIPVASAPGSKTGINVATLTVSNTYVANANSYIVIGF